MNGNVFRSLSLVFAAGCAGAVINSLAVWFFGEIGMSSALGVRIAPRLTAAWMYPRVVWGGIWGGVFLLPFWQKSVLVRGLLYSLGPSLVQLLVVFPLKAHKGLFGLDLGSFTPALVLLFNGIWGVGAALWLKICQAR